MGKTFDELVTLIGETYFVREDMSSVLPDFINMAMYSLEREYDWRHMETKSTGSLSSSSDEIATPSRYKNVKSFKIVTDSEDKILEKKTYKGLLTAFHDGSNVKGTPAAYAIKEADSVFVIRPYPDNTYSYELITTRYTADMSSGDSTGFWLETGWDVLVFKTLLEAADAGFMIDQEIRSGWEKAFATKLMTLGKTFIEEQFKGSYQNNNPTVTVI